MSDPKGSEEKSGGVLGWVKRQIVVEDDDGASAPAAVAPAKAVAPTQAAAPSTATQYRPPSSVSPDVDKKIRDKLKKTVHEAALPALAAFQDVEENLRAIPSMDERTRIQAALVSIRSQGYDLAAVNKDVDECFAALDQKEREADASAAKALKERIGSRESDIEAKTARVAQLRQEATTLETEVAQQRDAIATDRSEIDATHRSFKAAVADLRSEITETKRRITIYGRGE